ncbi:MAG: hypothetical protein GXO79_06600 [Chlorobi bacterium]|nr:hypothetical protein [Chlorobiota bacterium]
MLILVLAGTKLFSQDFEVSPVKLYFSAEPGESQTINLTVKNHGNKPETFILSLGDFLIDNKGTKEMLDANSTKNSCANWLSINPSFVEINPNESKLVGVTIMVPNGDYSTRWSQIFVRQVKERTSFTVDEGISAGIGVSPRIAVTVFQSPKSNSNYNAQINRLKEISQPGDSLRKFSVNVENIGDKITQCKVYLIAASLESAEEFPADTVILDTYPNSSRTIFLELPNFLPKGKYSLSAILDYSNAKTLEGTQMMIEVE